MNATSPPTSTTEPPHPAWDCLVKLFAQIESAHQTFNASPKTWTDYLDLGVAIHQAWSQYDQCVTSKRPTGA